MTLEVEEKHCQISDHFCGEFPFGVQIKESEHTG